MIQLLNNANILGIRIIVDNYNVIDNLLIPKSVDVADMRNDKARDDRLRALYDANVIVSEEDF